MVGLTDLLQRAEERPLFSPTPNPKRECYRLIWTRSFHPAVVLRLEAQDDAARLFVKVFGPNAADGLPIKLARSEIKPVAKDSLSVYRARFRQIKFWELPGREGDAGLDGSGWTLEALVAGHYWVVTRWTPRPGTPYFELGQLLIEQAIGGDLVPIY